MLTLSIHVTKLCSVDTEISVPAQAALVGSVIQDFQVGFVQQLEHHFFTLLQDLWFRVETCLAPLVVVHYSNANR